MGEHYDIKAIKEIDYILEIKVEKVKKEIWISQKAYTVWILERFDILKCKPRSILLSVGTSLSLNNGPEMKGEKKIKNISYYETLRLLI